MKYEFLHFYSTLDELDDDISPGDRSPHQAIYHRLRITVKVYVEYINKILNNLKILQTFPTKVVFFYMHTKLSHANVMEKILGGAR